MLGQKIIQINQNLLNESKIVIPFEYSECVYLVFIDSGYNSYTYKILNQ